jgi:hypothetical protein
MTRIEISNGDRTQNIVKHQRVRRKLEEYEDLFNLGNDYGGTGKRLQSNQI